MILLCISNKCISYSSILVPLVTATNTGEKKSGSLVSRSSLPLLEISFSVATGWAGGLDDGQLLNFLVLLKHLEFGFFGVLDNYFLLLGERVEVST